ncbi:hypothetical protein [Paenibacillus sinopodophylli]|uniref:hypothetical protein n=1 Tax=Paenibacillus sinopodophylli TaxID=1837342 RepID=UPI00110CFC11|nr:hypothetical protein [Paenibacillus sinopodophylli]
MAIQTYLNPETEEQLKLQTVSSLILLDGIENEWKNAYDSGGLSSLVVSSDGLKIYPYRGFHLDVDTRRVDCTNEIDVDLAMHLPPFINVSVLFGVSPEYEFNSIGPHMNDDINLTFSAQIKEILKIKPELSETKIHPNIPLSLCAKEPYLLKISPDQLLCKESDLTNAIEIINMYAGKGNVCWPISIRIEPIPTCSVHETLTSKSEWTKRLGQSWFEVENLISRYCPEASLGGRFSKLVNMCLWLYQWHEGMKIGSEEENQLFGGTIDALRIIQNEWRAWSKLHELNKCQNIGIPNWSERDVDLLSKILGNPGVYSFKNCFVNKRITDEHHALLSSLSTQYKVWYNPLAIAGTKIASITLDEIEHPSEALWCVETKIETQEDGFINICNCGEMFVKKKKVDTLVPMRCGFCDASFGQVNLRTIYERQQFIDGCIGVEQRFGRTTHSDCKDISELWSLVGTKLNIIDRYLDKSTIRYLEKVPTSIPIRILVSDDDAVGATRLNSLLTTIRKSRIKRTLEIKVVSCKKGHSSHPLHDRYVFSDDWGASLSSSLNALNSDSLWIFKIDDYHKMKIKYFDYFWNLPSGVPTNYGPRQISVRQIFL